MTIKARLFGLTILWCAIIGGLIGFKQHTVSTGRQVVFRAMSRGVLGNTLGVGPHVSLRYDINSIEMKSGTVSKYHVRDKVYVGLVISKGYAIVSGIHDTLPQSGFFIVGIVRAVGDDMLDVKYGIEHYYLNAGENASQYPYGSVLDVQVAIDSFGDSSILSLK